MEVWFAAGLISAGLWFGVLAAASRLFRGTWAFWADEPHEE